MTELCILGPPLWILRDEKPRRLGAILATNRPAMHLPPTRVARLPSPSLPHLLFFAVITCPKASSLQTQCDLDQRVMVGFMPVLANGPGLILFLSRCDKRSSFRLCPTIERNVPGAQFDSPCPNFTTFSRPRENAICYSIAKTPNASTTIFKHPLSWRRLLSRG